MSIRTLAIALEEVMDELFKLPVEEAVKVVLYHANRPKFADIITRALDRYAAILQQRMTRYREKGFVAYRWEVPADRLYNEANNKEQPEVKNHALMPYIRRNDATTPEREFAAFLEDNSACIDWWYKNGDTGKQNYAVIYTKTNGEKSLFYVDFVVRMKNGQLFLFDTKTEESDAEAVNKHNALIAYMNDEKNKPLHLKGGVIIRMDEIWKYSPVAIENTRDIAQWDSFFPDEYKS